MSHPWNHAKSSARKFGGKPEDYIEIHDFFDQSKEHLCDFRHRALRHHSEGIYMCEKLFGTIIKNSDGKDVPVRVIGEQHVKEDLGRIPTVSDWLKCLRPEPWMGRTPGTLEDQEARADRKSKKQESKPATKRRQEKAKKNRSGSR